MNYLNVSITDNSSHLKVKNCSILAYKQQTSTMTYKQQTAVLGRTISVYLWDISFTIFSFADGTLLLRGRMGVHGKKGKREEVSYPLSASHVPSHFALVTDSSRFPVFVHCHQQNCDAPENKTDIRHDILVYYEPPSFKLNQ